MWEALSGLIGANLRLSVRRYLFCTAHAQTRSPSDAASMSEAMFATCDKDGDGYLQGDELLVFLQACEKGSATTDAATRRIQELHTAIGPGVTGLEISLLKSMFAEPKRFNLPSRYHATTFDNLAVAPAQKNLERLQKMVAEAKQALTEADDVANPAESEAKRKEDERDEATQIFEKADAEAKRQVTDRAFPARILTAYI